MARAFKLTVLTPDRVLLAVDAVTRLRVRLSDDALLSVYPNHAPLIAETLSGPVVYDTATESGELAIAAGILRVEHTEVTLLTSGPARQGTGPFEAPEDLRFDRLAEQLMVALQAQPAAVAAPGEEEG